MRLRGEHAQGGTGSCGAGQCMEHSATYSSCMGTCAGQVPLPDPTEATPPTRWPRCSPTRSKSVLSAMLASPRLKRGPTYIVNGRAMASQTQELFCTRSSTKREASGRAEAPEIHVAKPSASRTAKVSARGMPCRRCAPILHGMQGRIAAAGARLL